MSSLLVTQAHTHDHVYRAHVIPLGHTRDHVWSHMWSHVCTFGRIHDHVWSQMWSRVITCMITCDPMHDHVWSHAWSRVITCMITCGHTHDHVWSHDVTHMYESRLVIHVITRSQTRDQNPQHICSKILSTMNFCSKQIRVSNRSLDLRPLTFIDQIRASIVGRSSSLQFLFPSLVRCHPFQDLFQPSRTTTTNSTVSRLVLYYKYLSISFHTLLYRDGVWKNTGGVDMINGLEWSDRRAGLFRRRLESSLITYNLEEIWLNLNYA